MLPRLLCWSAALTALLASSKGIIVWRDGSSEDNATSLLQEWTTPFAKEISREMFSNSDDTGTWLSLKTTSDSSLQDISSNSDVNSVSETPSVVAIEPVKSPPQETFHATTEVPSMTNPNQINVTKVVRYVFESVDAESALDDAVMFSDGTETEPTSNRTAIYPKTILRDTFPEIRTLSNVHIYIIGIVGIVPAAGAFAWCVKRLWTKSKKNLDLLDHPLDLPLAIPGSCQLGPPLYRLDESESSRYSPSSKRFHKKERDENEHNNDADICYIHPRNKYFPLEFPRSQIQFLEVLGEGNFGQVWKARAFYFGPRAQPLTVAVKTVKENSTYKDKQDLLQEVEIMHQLGYHPNVVQLIGCCTDQEPYLIIMEYVTFGKLLTYLRDHRSRRDYYNYSSSGISSADLTLFSYQVAKGMEFISAHGIIHRDLAARNILVDHNKVCKVADFGLSKSIRERNSEVYEQKSKGALPIRWMAPESLYMNVFTSKSDVWAFGILMWEIVTLGSTPYPGMGAREVIRGVRDGYVMSCPEHCRPELYAVMRQCWATDPNMRPNFTQLRASLGRLLEMQTGYIDLEHFPEHAYYNIYHSSGEKV